MVWRGVVHPDQNSLREEGEKTKIKGKGEERRKDKEKEKEEEKGKERKERENIFRYYRYTGGQNRSKKLVEKKARFGFVLYSINFG